MEIEYDIVWYAIRAYLLEFYTKTDSIDLLLFFRKMWEIVARFLGIIYSEAKTSRLPQPSYR